MTSILGTESIQHPNGTTAATIDSTGRILTPARPAFRAEKRASNQSISDTTTTKVTFEHEAFDIGGNFASDKFTAPVAGIYHFNTLLRCVANSGTMDYVLIYLYKNGSIYSDMSQIQTSANNMLNSHIGGGATLQLAASDYIEIYVNISGTSPLVHSHSNGERTWFSGFLIG